MALPAGFKKNSDGSYSANIVNDSNVKTTVKTTLDGRQQILSGDGKVIFEKNLGDKNWQTKDNGLSKKLGNEASSVQQVANGQSYRLIQSEGSKEQKQAANNSEAFKGSKNKLFDTDKWSEEARTRDVPPANPNLQIKGGGRVQYPLTMTDAQDKIRFTAVEIDPGTKSTYIKRDASIYIAVQAPIQDTNTVKWGESNQNALQEAFLDGAAAIGNADQSALEKLGKRVSDTFAETGAEASEYILGKTVGQPEAFSRSTKKILNPNLELLFQGPQLRTFQMTFKMSARDKEEAAVIKAIIRYFKYHMSVKKDSGGVFLRSPHVFTIQYLKGLDIHQSIGLISPKISGKTRAAALLSLNVDYTPLGTYATFDDEEATMVAYTMNMQFQEIEVVYDTDYLEGEGKDHSIGY